MLGACVLLVCVPLIVVALWPDPDGSTEVTVPADHAWTDTGVDVDAGDVVTVTSTGEIVHDTSQPEAVGPDGDSRTELRIYNVVEDVNHAALIGRIGDDAAPVFLVGASTQFIADRSGILYLGINDAGPGNNTGSFTSVVTSEAALTVGVRSCGTPHASPEVIRRRRAPRARHSIRRRSSRGRRASPRPRSSRPTPARRSSCRTRPHPRTSIRRSRRTPAVAPGPAR